MSSNHPFDATGPDPSDVDPSRGGSGPIARFEPPDSRPFRPEKRHEPTKQSEPGKQRVRKIRELKKEPEPGPGAFAVEPSVTRALATILLVLLVGGLALSWRQYRSDRRFITDEARNSVGAFAELTDRLIKGRQETLLAFADTSAVKNNDLATMKANFDRFIERTGNGAIGWVNENGLVEASSDFPLNQQIVDVRDRPYFRDAVSSRAPAVSGGIIARVSGRPIFMIAIPTFSNEDRSAPNGVLFWGSQLEDFNRELLLLVPDDKISVIDRDNQIILGRANPLMTKPSERFAMSYVRTTGMGLLRGRDGNGRPDKSYGCLRFGVECRMVRGPRRVTLRSVLSRTQVPRAHDRYPPSGSHSSPCC